MDTNINNNITATVNNGEISAGDFLKEVQKLEENIKKTNGRKEENPFPVDAFPLQIQGIINETHSYLNFPIDFIGSALLYAISVVIGNTHKVQFKKGYEQSAALYLAIVGRAGTAKTHALNFALKPIQKQDSIKFKEFQKEKREFDDISSLTSKERTEQGRELPSEKPFWNQILVSDFTQEALADVLRVNGRGLGVYSDELAGWINNFNRYSKGSEEEFWLSAWSGTPLRINRRSDEPRFIQVPFISVAGGIQPAILSEMAKGRTENGFIDRILFTISEDAKKEYWSDKEINSTTFDQWERIINNILAVPLNENEYNEPCPKVLKFRPEAKEKILKWTMELTDFVNASKDDKISSMYSKLEQYLLRFSLCMEVASYACNESSLEYITLDSVEKALKLIEYFKSTAMKVLSLVSDPNPVDKLPKNKQELYEALPSNFKTKEGLEIAKKLGVAERTFKYFLTNKELFVNLRTGEYIKQL